MSAIEPSPGALPGRSTAARRFVDAVLRSYGAAEIVFRVAVPSSGDDASQLGITPPPSQDLPISPVVVKPLPASDDAELRLEILVSASSLQSIARQYGVRDICAWLLGLEGLVYQDDLLRIAAVTADQFCGVDCLYRITATE